MRRLRTVTLPAGSRWWRSSRHAAADLVPGVGDTRFAPLDGVRHAYIGATRTVTLLETVLHAAAGPAPTIYAALLAGWRVTEVALGADMTLVDLRDTRLTAMGLARHQLVDTVQLHYPCTREWASALHRRTIRGEPVAGILWHSRQADLYGRAHPDGLLADVLHHAPAEVAVLWHPPAPASPLSPTGATVPLLEDGAPSRLLEELSSLIGAPIER